MKFLLLLAVLFLATSCEESQQVGQPPIGFSFRKSQVPTKGMVVAVRNESQSETLTEFVVRVQGKNEKEIRTHRVNTPVEPEDSITVGWVELDGWDLKPGDTVSVQCKQYSTEKSTVVPKL